MPVKCSKDEKPHMQPKIGSELIESTCRGEARGHLHCREDRSSDIRYFLLLLSGHSCSYLCWATSAACVVCALNYWL